MTEISAALVKELREETNVGMMECKRALVDAGGDKAKAVKILRERGMAVAQKKASRAANQGIIASAIVEQGRIGSLVEVNCETDFVAKNDGFKSFVKGLAEKAAATDGSLAEEAGQEVVAKIAEIGENIVVRRNIRYKIQDAGMIVSYIHHGSTLGILAEIGCGKPETLSNSLFAEVAKDICLHIAACNPKCTDEQSVPKDVIAAEREIYAQQVKDKPQQIIDKIVDGKIRKFCEQICLVHQPFVKDQDKTVGAFIKEHEAAMNDTIVVRRFARFQVGEAL